MWILTQQSDAKTQRGQTSCLLPGNQVEFPGRGTASSGKHFHHRRSRARVHASLRKKVARKTGTTQQKKKNTTSRDGRSRSRLRLSAAHQRDWEMQTPAAAAAAVAKQIVRLLHERKKNQTPTTTRKRETTAIRHSLCFLGSGRDGKRGGEEK